MAEWNSRLGIYWVYGHNIYNLCKAETYLIGIYWTSMECTSKVRGLEGCFIMVIFKGTFESG